MQRVLKYSTQRMSTCSVDLDEQYRSSKAFVSFNLISLSCLAAIVRNREMLFVETVIDSFCSVKRLEVSLSVMIIRYLRHTAKK